MVKKKSRKGGRQQTKQQTSGNNNFFSNLIVATLIFMAVFYVKDNFFTNSDFEMPSYSPKKTSNISNDIVNDKTIQKTQESNKVEQTNKSESAQKVEKSVPVVDIYFTSATQSGLKKVTRTLPNSKSKVAFAVEELLKGPDFKEKNHGYSSEIPKGTRLLGVYEVDGNIIVNLSDEFQYGGGTESQYSRLNQLIKTVLAQKTSKPVYLYLNGVKAETIGGEGIILTQPLSENSLNG